MLITINFNTYLANNVLLSFWGFRRGLEVGGVFWRLRFLWTLVQRSAQQCIVLLLQHFLQNSSLLGNGPAETIQVHSCLHVPKHFLQQAGTSESFCWLASCLRSSRCSVDGLSFHLGFKDADVPHREKHSERKDGTGVFSLPLSSSLADSHLQGSLLQSRWQQGHFPSIQQHSYCILTLCQALPGELVLNPGTWWESAPQVSNTLHLPRNCLFHWLPYKSTIWEPLPYNPVPFFLHKRYNRRKIQITDGGLHNTWGFVDRLALHTS